MAVTHNHSSPMYSSTAWGVWAFQDVYDVRFFEYVATFMARAVRQAAAQLKPARVGASVSQFDKTHRHSFGGAVADDGTPAGYPVSDIDKDLTVLRFDDVSTPGKPKPIATLVNWGGHPEFLDGNDLISADYIGPMERMTDRRTRGVTIFTQGDVGTAEPERSANHSIHERLEFTHREYAQADYAGYLISQKIVRHLARHRARHAGGRGAFHPVHRRPARSLRWTSGSRVRSRTLTRACRRAGPTPGSTVTRACRSSGCPTASAPSRGRTPLRTSLDSPSHRRRRPTRSIRASPPTTSRRAGIPVPGELLGALIRCGAGGRVRASPGAQDRRHPADVLLVRAVEGPEPQHQDAHEPRRRATSISATTGRRSARSSPTRRGSAPTRARAPTTATRRTSTRSPTSTCSACGRRC